MKGGLAAMMITAKILNQMRDNLRGKLLLQFAIGEEAGEPGTRYMLLDAGYGETMGLFSSPQD